MRRPILSDTSFLAHLFSPKKNPQPTGIRKKTLKGLKGQSKSRVAAFNRMSPVNQELLKRSGLRDLYLRGDASLTDARRSVRPRAVEYGVARPLAANRPVLRVPRPMTHREQVNAQVARHIKRTLADSNKRFNAVKISERVPRIPDYIVEFVGDWDYHQISDAARKGSPFDVIEDGEITFNPFWYG